MKTKLLLILFFVVANAFGQLDFNDNSKTIKTKFENGIPKDPSYQFGMNYGEIIFSNVKGLRTTPYVYNKAASASFSIDAQNIGNVVVHARLFNKKDSSFFNTKSVRKGKLKIIPFRNGEALEAKAMELDFQSDNYKQIYFNTERADVSKVVITSETDYDNDDILLFEYLEVTPYNAKGTRFYKEREASEQQIRDLTSQGNKTGEVIKNNYYSYVTELESFHKNLNTLITGDQFASIAQTQANSMNPFNSDDFTKSYFELLNRTESHNLNDIKSLVSDVKNNKFKTLAETVDEIFLGGKITQIIGLVDGIFNANFKLENSGVIVPINGEYYGLSNNISSNTLKFKPIDLPTKTKIQAIKDKNEAYKTFILRTATFIKNDANRVQEHKKNLEEAKALKQEIENLIWLMLVDLTNQKRDIFIDETEVNFTKIGSEIKSSKKIDRLSLKQVNTLKAQSLIVQTKYDEASGRYSNLIDLVKTHYDVLYKELPNQRKSAFDDLSNLPADIKLDWSKKQEVIENEYAKNNGLESLLDVIAKD